MHTKCTKNDLSSTLVKNRHIWLKGCKNGHPERNSNLTI